MPSRACSAFSCSESGMAGAPCWPAGSGIRSVASPSAVATTGVGRCGFEGFRLDPIGVSRPGFPVMYSAEHIRQPQLVGRSYDQTEFGISSSFRVTTVPGGLPLRTASASMMVATGPSLRAAPLPAVPPSSSLDTGGRSGSRAPTPDDTNPTASSLNSRLPTPGSGVYHSTFT